MRAARRSATAAGCVVAGAAVAAFSATRVWWSATLGDTPAGPRTVTATGSAAVPELVPVALVALAGLGAALATKGLARRVIGVVVAVVGLLIAGRSLLAAWQPPRAALSSAVGGPAADPTAHPGWAIAAAVGGLLVAAGGLLLAARAPAASGLGRRFDPRAADPAARPAESDAAAAGAVDETATRPSDLELWRAMDAGDDPTVGEPDVGTDVAGPGRPVIRPGNETDKPVDPDVPSTGSDGPPSGG